MKPTFSFLIFLTAALLSGEELLNLQSTIPVSVEGWTRSKVSGVMPSNWKSAAKMNSEFTCKVIQENGQSVFTCDLKKGCAYFIIPAPEIKVARPTEFSITMKRPEERDCESILSVKGGKTPPMKSIWHGSFLTGIRLTYAPGKQTWKSTINAPDWRNDQYYWLLLELDDPGLYKIYSVATRVLPPGRPYYTLRKDETNPINRIRNSRFPLGLPTGWTTGARYHDSIRVSTEKGPSGERFLILESKHPQTSLNSEAFNPEDFSKPNYVSFSYRATGYWDVHVYTGEGSSARMKKTVLPQTGTWKRILLKYQPCENARGHVLQFRGHGRLELDAVRANDRPEISYKPQNQAEVALALPATTDAAQSHIQFADEPAKVRYLLTGETRSPLIRFRAVNLYGETFDLGSVSTASGEIDFSSILKQRPFGQFRIEAFAEKAGKRISPINEIVVTRLARPLHWGKDAPDSYFGAIAELDRSLLSLKAGGVNHVRLHDHGGLQFTGWFFTEPERGKWKFFDEEIARYRKHHLWIFGELGTTPLWANKAAGNPMLKNDYRSKWMVPANNELFEHYVTTITRHYQKHIRNWGVGNEPWGSFFFEKFENGRLIRGDQNRLFAAYQNSAFKAAKCVDPDFTIAGVNATIRDTNWAKNLMLQGAKNSCDIVELHLYSSAWNGFPGDRVSRGVKEALGTADWGKPIWNTECQGCASGNCDRPLEPQIGLLYHSIPWVNKFDYNADADRQMRFIISNLANGMKRIYLYSARMGRFQMCIMQPAPVLALEQTDGFPSPQLVAHSALARRIDGRIFREVFEVAPNIWCYLFESQEGTTAVVIPRRFTKSVTIPCALKKVSASDLYGNPLPLPLQSGNTLRYIEASVNAQTMKRALQKNR